MLRRAGFGGTRAQIDALTPLDWPAVVDRVLDTSTPFPDPPPPEIGSTVSYWEQFTALQRWWLDRMATTPTPIVEKMTLFWHGLFTTSFQKTYEPDWITAQHRFYRAHAMGDLASLAQGMAVQPAMLDYLDNGSSKSKAPNENFARELMELFLLGIGHYTQDDVVAAARAWTGHGYDRTTRAYRFRAEWHDSGTKSFLGHTGNLDGPDTIAIMLTDAAIAPVTARWVTTKLWEFFAHPGPPPGVIEDLAATYLQSGFDTRAVLRALFLRPEFRSTATVQGRVRSPIEYVVAVLRGLGVTAGDIRPDWYLRAMGQEPFNPPSVEGWKHNAYWLSTAATGAKARFVWHTTWKLGEIGRHPFVGTSSLDRDALVQLAFDTLAVTEPAPATRTAIGDWLTAQRAAPHDTWAEPHGLLTMILLSPDLQLA